MQENPIYFSKFSLWQLVSLINGFLFLQKSSFIFSVDNFDCTKKIIALERWTYDIIFFIFFLSPTFIRVKVVQLTFYRFNKLSNNLLLLTKKVPLQLCSIVNFPHHSCLQWNNKNIKKIVVGWEYIITMLCNMEFFKTLWFIWDHPYP